jgi:hypothetical protein
MQPGYMVIDAGYICQECSKGSQWFVSLVAERKANDTDDLI